MHPHLSPRDRFDGPERNADTFRRGPCPDTCDAPIRRMSRRRIGRVVYLVAFIAIQQFTSVFTQYPTLELLGIVGVAVVFLDAVVCARRSWRSLDIGVRGDSTADN